MSRLQVGLLLVASAALVSGCMVAAPVIPPPGLVQTFSAPLDLDHAATPLGAKRGEATAHNVLGIVTWGDASTNAAAKSAGITTLHSADYEFFTVFGVYSAYTTIVHGD